MVLMGVLVAIIGDASTGGSRVLACGLRRCGHSCTLVCALLVIYVAANTAGAGPDRTKPTPSGVSLTVAGQV